MLSTFSRTALQRRLLIVRGLAVNALEESLEKAATDPNHRPQFFRDLMDSSIYVVNSVDDVAAESSSQQQQGGGLYLQQWQVDPPSGSSSNTPPKVILPFFSSLENLRQACQDDQAKHAKLECRNFLELVKEYRSAIVLNPGLPYGKQFFPQEIAGLLDGSLLAPPPAAASQETIPTGTKLIMGQPKEYPVALTEALKSTFHNNTAVQAAYLAQVYVPDSGEPPNVYIGMELIRGAQDDATFQSVLQDAIRVQQETCPDEIVDFVQVAKDSEDTVVEYLRDKTTPFYSRSSP
ncbi:Protein SseB [Seminavis robusta]|uniref:Protein SseB n=1 Tax=Seminavis robusta TaxID=568900 RepID=A0A9N8HH33_9STRA|nr:Protein SseB [Seminavis robusta]|eukprot:Sro612_g175410.1 Protein SseB (292) ;mRNA; f:9425-10300